MNQFSPNASSVTSVTLNELIEKHGDKMRHGLMGECLIANTHSQLEMYRFPCRINAFIFGVGTAGSTQGFYNLRPIELHKNSFFLFTPDTLFQADPEGHFETMVFCIAPDLMRDMQVNINRLLPLFMRLDPVPCIDITDEQRQELRTFISMIERELSATETTYSPSVVRALIAALMNKVGALLESHFASRPDYVRVKQNRADVFFRKFLAVLSQHYKEKRGVAFYAQPLCITPKYLTTMVKRVSNRSASEWIDMLVITEAKSMLKYTNMSIQEIAYTLHFANQSFFGSYFKRHTGLSPSEYKAQQ